MRGTGRLSSRLHQKIDGFVDFLAGHVAFTAVFHDAHGFGDHRGIHNADRTEYSEWKFAFKR